jgi:hypothetical protein
LEPPREVELLWVSFPPQTQPILFEPHFRFGFLDPDAWKNIY